MVEIKNCPECGALVEVRTIDVETASLLVYKTVQVKLGPKHQRQCPSWRRENPMMG